MATNKKRPQQDDNARLEQEAEYLEQMFSFVPLYTTRLVREGEMSYDVRRTLRSPEDVAEMFYDYFRDKDREEVLLLLLDTGNSAIGVVNISTGGLAASIVEPRQVFKAAILANASSIILVHNHPSGRCEESREDVRISKQLVECGKIMGIPLNDHIIVCEQAYTSLAERGLL